MVLTTCEASVLGDALRHGVVKVGLWRLPDRPVIGADRQEAATRLSRAGLLYSAGQSLSAGVQCLTEEYLPTPRSRWRPTDGTTDPA